MSGADSSAASSNRGGSRLARSGWLWKRGQRRKNWKKRWHVIDPKDKCLRYFKDQATSEELGSVNLVGAVILDPLACKEQLGVEADKFGDNASFGIKEAGTDRLFFVSDESVKSRAEWIRMLGFICRSAGGKAAVSRSVAVGSPDASGSEETPGSAAGGGGGGAPATRRAAEPWTPGEPFSHAREFKQARKAGTRLFDNESSRLKNRVQKLIGTVPASFLTQEKFERSVVPWEDGGQTCPSCRNAFNRMRTPRSNCRLCGKNVCTNARCSDEVALAQIATFLGVDPMNTKVVTRVCSDCKAEVERARGRGQVAPGSGKFLKLYSTIVENKSAAETSIESFHAITATRSRPNAEEVMRIKEIKADIDKAFRTVQAASQMMTAQPEAGSGPWKTVSGNVRDACMTWQQPRSVAIQSKMAK